MFRRDTDKELKIGLLIVPEKHIQRWRFPIAVSLHKENKDARKEIYIFVFTYDEQNWQKLWYCTMWMWIIQWCFKILCLNVSFSVLSLLISRWIHKILQFSEPGAFSCLSQGIIFKSCMITSISWNAKAYTRDLEYLKVFWGKINLKF